MYRFLLCLALLSMSAFVFAANSKSTVGRAFQPDTKRSGKNARPTNPSRLRLGSPIAERNLTVFPIYHENPRQVPSDYLTLEEALKENLIEVKEMGDAEVSRVSVTSRASKPILLIAGDIILGGQQDRIVAKDIIIPAKAKDFVVEVFCVEQGRWSGGRHFQKNIVASSGLRYEAQRTKQQQKVWDKVAEERRNVKAGADGTTYAAVTAKPEVKRDLDSYVKSLQSQLAKDRRAVGVIIAVNGKVTAGDVFADPKLFQKQLPKILNSYALEAAQAKEKWDKMASKRIPARRDAQTLLTEGTSGKRRRVWAQSDTTINFETDSPTFSAFQSAPATPAFAGRLGKQSPSGKGRMSGGAMGGQAAHTNFFRK